MIFLCIFRVFYSLFIYFKRESTQGGAEREGERIPSRLHAARAELNVRLNLTNHEMMIGAEIKSWMPHRPSHPGALVVYISGKDRNNGNYFPLPRHYSSWNWANPSSPTPLGAISKRTPCLNFSTRNSLVPQLPCLLLAHKDFDVFI